MLKVRHTWRTSGRSSKRVTEIISVLVPAFDSEMHSIVMPNNIQSPHEFHDAESGYRVVSVLPRLESKHLVDRVLGDEIEFDPVYKNTSKCLVGRFRYPDVGQLVLKVPRARSHRRWERFLTLFRSGEGLRQFNNMQKLLDLGLKGPQPILAAEKRRKGIVIDSFYTYGFVEGREGSRNDLDLIVEALLPLYEKGYCRADPQVANHIIHGNDVYLIDFRITRPLLFGRLRCAMELCQLVMDKPLGIQLGRRIGVGSTLVITAWKAQRLSQRVRKIRQRLKARLQGVRS